MAFKIGDHVMVLDENLSLLDDLNCILNNNDCPQSIAARETSKYCYNLLKNSNYKFSLTGHSLGGYLSEISFFHLYLDEKRKIPAIIFDTPGAERSVKKL